MPATGITVETLTEPTEGDAATLARLIPDLSSAPPPDLAELRDLVSQNATTVLVARLDGSIVGTLSLVMFAVPSGRRAWIEDVVVDRSHRGQGIATRLIDAAVGIASSAGCRTVDLTSRPSRNDANRLYERCGFARRETNVYRYSLGT